MRATRVLCLLPQDRFVLPPREGDSNLRAVLGSSLVPARALPSEGVLKAFVRWEGFNCALAGWGLPGYSLVNTIVRRLSWAVPPAEEDLKSLCFALFSCLFVRFTYRTAN